MFWKNYSSALRALPRLVLLMEVIVQCTILACVFLKFHASFSLYFFFLRMSLRTAYVLIHKCMNKKYAQPKYSLAFPWDVLVHYGTWDFLPLSIGVRGLVEPIYLLKPRIPTLHRFFLISRFSSVFLAQFRLPQPKSTLRYTISSDIILRE